MECNHANVPFGYFCQECGFVKDNHVAHIDALHEIVTVKRLEKTTVYTNGSGEIFIQVGNKRFRFQVEEQSETLVIQGADVHPIVRNGCSGIELIHRW